jgi:hypothetical protein
MTLTNIPHPFEPNRYVSIEPEKLCSTIETWLDQISMCPDQYAINCSFVKIYVSYIRAIFNAIAANQS